MVRRVLKQYTHSIDNERLIVLTIFEDGMKKEHVKRLNEFSKRHLVLYSAGKKFEYKGSGEHVRKG